MTGWVVTWWASGALRSAGRAEGGLRVGPWQWADPDGRVIRSHDYGPADARLAAAPSPGSTDAPTLWPLLGSEAVEAMPASPADD